MPIWIQIAVSVVTIVGIVFGAWKGLQELRRAREQRQDELKQRRLEFRHTQAVFALERVREVFSDKQARSALRMLDWLRSTYTTEDGTTLVIRRSDLQSALRIENLVFTKEERYIRFCFEALYDYLEQIERLIQLDVLNFSDLETTFRYYARIALLPSIKHFGFLGKYDYPKAKAFLERFDLTEIVSGEELVDDESQDEEQLQSGCGSSG